ncbi:MAG: Rpn family recombination-promoting nuclease/putative transposase, partial [Candidatus Sericytochromatia bacterium]
MDHDRLFKELLSTFFFDFLRLFLPELADQIVEATLAPLDKEIFTDVTAGERHEVDLLVQARLAGEASFILIHVETQASRQPDFAKRMFRYFARLHEKHDRPVYPIALFTYGSPRRPEPERYDVAIQGFHVLGFHFRAIQLNQLSWKDFKEARNPVASALMTRMGVAREDRPRVKWECYRMLVKLELDPARLQLLSGFIDAYLPLEPREETEFKARAATGTPEEREAVMELTNSWIERGREEGRKEGREESRQREAELACRLLQKRLGS